MVKPCIEIAEQRRIIGRSFKIANQSDIIVAALGESAEMSGESSSRTNLSIPQAQKDLLQELLKTGKPVVLVLFTGRALVLVEENETVPAILNSWFAGSEAEMRLLMYCLEMKILPEN